ncbi:hypothetical protein SAMN05192583_3340 [Sphingomonas gellani]|uniref:Uncharacterized protein n=1 Tax=Sphingomonas gellani TaxID=1166340 RepID=A0A1H8IM19_9SPHN|nr:hypothetical protein [Sphingomonas gellani]SEN69584.1 hypothetical protein SAMN05192583_3340 [Sphingomonas gellani]
MAFMERIIAPATDGERAVVRLLRHYCTMRDREGDGTALSRLVMLGQSLHLPPAGSVALASVFQLTEAVLGRRLVAECCCARGMSNDERAIVRLLGNAMPSLPDTATPNIPHGLPGALAWAILSVRRLCGDIVTPWSRTVTAEANGCPFMPSVTN